MIIEAKANRPANEPPDPRQKFEFNAPEKTSRLPVYLALLITSIAVYLKSAFPSHAHDDAPADPGKSPPAVTPPHHHGVAPAQPRPDHQPDASDSPDQPRPDLRPDDSGASFNTGFQLLDPVSFTYAAPTFEPFGPQVAAHFPAAFRYQPQNDNAQLPDPGPSRQPPPASRSVAPSGVVTPPVNRPDDTEDAGDDDDDEDGDGLHAPANRPPISMGPVRLHEVFAGQMVLIGLSQLLLGTSDPDGDTLTINDLSVSGGTLVQTETGWSVATLPGLLGEIRFSYDISDGVFEIAQTASLQVVRNSVLLTPADDVFVGTPYDDDIAGLAGDDIIDARAGNDSVVGGMGDDHINGGADDDQLLGGQGDDVILGGDGDDVIGGGGGDDLLFGDAGDDIIDGDAGNDILVGGDGADILRGGAGDDALEGDAGDDVLIAGAGDDNASGGAGDDVIDGNGGDDTLAGGAGNDIIDGGDGNDVLAGNAGDDTLLGGAGDDTVLGDAGNDMLDGGAGNDVLAGNAGDDIIDGGAGDDIVLGDAGNDVIDGGAGHDVLDYSGTSAPMLIDLEGGTALSAEVDQDRFTQIEEFIGSQGDDVFVIGATAAIITGGRGDDLFVFTVTDDRPVLSQQLVHEILDFVVGDRIHVADYEISRHAEMLEADRFEQVYDAPNDGFEASLPIRITHAFYDDMDHTIIEADVNRDDVYEIAIALHGVSLPLHIDGHIA